MREPPRFIPPPVRADMTDPLASRLQAAVAAELRQVRAGLEALAQTFAGDARFAADYLEQLQAFDLLIQHTDESAGVLDRLGAGAAPHEAAAPVRLHAVQRRLNAALRQDA